MSDKKFTITIRTKPYVNRFIQLNFGDPADFSKDKEIYELFRNSLSKPSSRYDNRYDELSFSRYSSITSINISEDDFYRYGWELTKTDTVAFGKKIEARAKFMMRMIVSVLSGFMQEKDAIEKFQTDFMYPEDIWSFGSIKKDYYRFAPCHKLNFKHMLSNEILNIFMVNLSNLGTISPLAVSNYGNTRETA